MSNHALTRILLCMFVMTMYTKPLWAAPAQWLEYEGTFSDVTFVKGQRVVNTLKLELYVPEMTGALRTSPGLSGTLRIVNPTNPKSAIDYTIKNAYVTNGVSLYLATKGTSAITLMLGTAPRPGETAPGLGTLLFSDRDSARAVSGKWHAQAIPRHHR